MDTVYVSIWKLLDESNCKKMETYTGLINALKKELYANCALRSYLCCHDCRRNSEAFWLPFSLKPSLTFAVFSHFSPFLCSSQFLSRIYSISLMALSIFLSRLYLSSFSFLPLSLFQIKQDRSRRLEGLLIQGFSSFRVASVDGTFSRSSSDAVASRLHIALHSSLSQTGAGFHQRRYW